MYQVGMNESLHPVSSWVWPSKAELNSYLSEVETTNPSALDLETVCENPLGFYLFLQFVENRGLKVMAYFIRSCATYRNLLPGMRLQSAIDMVLTYLMCKYPVLPNCKWPSTLKRKLRSKRWKSMNAALYFNSNDSDNCIHVKGPPYEEVLHTLGTAMNRLEMEGLISSQVSTSSNGDLNNTVHHSRQSTLPTRRRRRRRRRTSQVSGNLIFSPCCMPALNLRSACGKNIINISTHSSIIFILFRYAI